MGELFTIYLMGVLGHFHKYGLPDRRKLVVKLVWHLPPDMKQKQYPHQIWTLQTLIKYADSHQQVNVMDNFRINYFRKPEITKKMFEDVMDNFRLNYVHKPEITKKMFVDDG